MNSVKNGMSSLNNSSNYIYGNINKINTSTKTLSMYIDALHTGTSELYSGTSKLYSGTKDLSIGVNQINDGVISFKDQLYKLNIKGNAENISKSVAIKESSYKEVKNYGYGFAPYFISLGLFVGALISTIVINSKDDKKKNGKSHIVKHILAFGFVVIGQVLIVNLVVLTTRIHIANIIQFSLFTLLISIAYMALIEMLTTIFGDIGRYVCIILLILQLTASGGTFPVETSPKFFQMIHDFMPMTYTVEGLRMIIGNGNTNILLYSSLVLISIAVISYTIIVLYFKNSKKYS